VSWLTWKLRWWAKGYRIVDQGNEVDGGTAVHLATDTIKRYRRDRSGAVKIDGTRWVVMVRGWNRKKEDG
jgi:hypothetical protein